MRVKCIKIPDVLGKVLGKMEFPEGWVHNPPPPHKKKNLSVVERWLLLGQHNNFCYVHFLFNSINFYSD